jgi:hypothetical protein
MCKIEPNWGDSQAGRPRPGRQPTPATLCHETSLRVTWAQDQVTPRWVWQNSQDKAERLEPSRVEVKSSDNPKNQSPIQLVKQCGPTEQHDGATRAWAEQEPGRLAPNRHRWSHTTSTNFKRRSRASLQRRWPRCHIPRPAGLGEAGQPHLAAFAALPWRGRQAQRTYLRATDAQPSTDLRVV